MSGQTKIEWADSTFNPWIGCSKVSPGCDNCYAEVSTPARTMGIVWGPQERRHRTSAANWAQPIKWEREAAAFYAEHGRRRRVFCASLADVFDNAVDNNLRSELLALIYRTPNLEWLVLTKRIGNVPKLMEECTDPMKQWELPPNVWLGISVVNQEEADRDIPKLLAIPARIHWLSMEPLLGPVDLFSNIGGTQWIGGQRGCGGGHKGNGAPECPRELHHHHDDRCNRGIDWIVVGGESGRNARPMHLDWVSTLRDQCEAAGTAFLFKQWGEWKPADDDMTKRLPFNKWKEFPVGSDEARDVQLRGDAATQVVQFVGRVGKKSAGREIDGVTWDQFPR